MSLVKICSHVSICASLFLAPSLAFANEGNSIELNEVTVTGEKVDRSLQETTTAISVFQGNSINSQEVRSAYDVASEVPNMINNPAEIPVIRGVSGAGPASGSNAFVTGARPRISTTIDGLSESWSGQRYLDIGSWDIEQIEVLRGPQSTSQGRNSMGGAVVINTKDPTFTPEGAIRLGYENEDDKATAAVMISGPIYEDELALRLAAQGLKGHGFINYNQGDYAYDPSEIEQKNVRGKLLWRPKNIEGLNVKLTATYRTQEGEYLSTIEEPYSNYMFYHRTSNTRRTDTTNGTLSTDVDYILNDTMTLKMIAGHSDYKAHFLQSPSFMTLDLDEKSNTLEARLMHEPVNGLISSMVGLYFYDRSQNLQVSGNTFHGDDEITTVALFTEESLHVTDKLDVILGGRLEKEHQERDVYAWTGHVDTDLEKTLFLPKIGVNYKLTPEHYVGFTVRKGYTPGGGSLYDDTINHVYDIYYEFDKEDVWAYEATTRSWMLDKTWSINTNLFYNDYEGYQGVLNNRITNIPKGKSYGYEVESTYLALSNLELHGGFGLLRTEITQAPTGLESYKGNEFNYAPHFTGSLGFKHKLNGGFFYGSDLNYIGKYYSDIENNEALKAGDYVLVNFNAGYEYKNYAIRTYLKNAFDEEVFYSRATSSNGNSAKVGQPRAFGVTFDYKF